MIPVIIVIRPVAMISPGWWSIINYRRLTWNIIGRLSVDHWLLIFYHDAAL
jgi:hypothetical protein